MEDEPVIDLTGVYLEMDDCSIVWVERHDNYPYVPNMHRVMHSPTSGVLMTVTAILNDMLDGSLVKLD